MRYTGGEAFVEVLKKQGVDAIFCSPGTEWAPVWEALVKFRAQGIQTPEYFNFRHEMLACSAAIGYAQKSGKLPVLLLHSSTGLLHGAMAIRGAYLERVPMLVCAGESVRFTEGQDPEERGISWLHMLSDVGGSSRIAAPFVKWSQAVTSRETLSGTIARASQIGRVAPPGPVFLSLSKEYLQDEREEIIPQIPLPWTASSPDPADMEKIASLLIESQNPIIITELLGNRPEAVEKLVELAEALAIPVFETQSSFNFPKEHPLHAGFNVSGAIGEADLVLAIAAATPWNPQRANPRPEAKIVFIDGDALYQQFPYWNFRADMIVAADPLPALHALVAIAKIKKPSSAFLAKRLEYWKTRHDQRLSSWDREALDVQTKRPIDPQWLCYAINKWLPPDAMVVRETTSDAPAVTRQIHATKPGNFYRGNMKGLGAGMGVALGIKLASPSQPVVHLVGDGAFNYAPVPAAFGFAQEYGLPILTIVFNNGAYRAMQAGHLCIYPEGWAARTKTFHGVDIAPRPDYTQFIKAFDGFGEKVEDPQKIAPALERAWREIQKGRSALLDVIL